MDVTLADFANERDQRQGFADTCRMKPDQRATWAFGTRIAKPFKTPLLILFAFRCPVGQVGPRERIGGHSRHSVTRQGKTCDPAVHTMLPSITLRNAFPPINVAGYF